MERLLRYKHLDLVPTFLRTPSHHAFYNEPFHAVHFARRHKRATIFVRRQHNEPVPNRYRIRVFRRDQLIALLVAECCKRNGGANGCMRGLPGWNERFARSFKGGQLQPSICEK